MILAVTELEQPVRGHIGRDGSRSHTGSFGVQVVDANKGLIEGAFVLAPVLGHAQVIQTRRQPISGTIAWQDLWAQRATERLSGNPPVTSCLYQAAFLR